MSSTVATAPTPALDLRGLAPRQRNAIALARFDALKPGQSLQLLNDQDPQALRAQFEERCVGQFEWTTLEAGPGEWCVQIDRIGARPAPAVGDACCSGGACCG